MRNKYCPICKEENKCMPGNNENKNCWCTTIEFHREIFELVPEESLYIDCICLDCLLKFKKAYY